MEGVAFIWAWAKAACLFIPYHILRFVLAGLPPAGLPPAGLSPAGLPPDGLPPVGLPPAGLPPVGLPPARLSPAGLPPAGLPPALAGGYEINIMPLALAKILTLISFKSIIADEMIIFLLEGLLVMVFLLILDVFAHPI